MKKNYNFKENNSSSDNEDFYNDLCYDTNFYNQKDRSKRRYETNIKNKKKRYNEDKWN